MSLLILLLLMSFVLGACLHLDLLARELGRFR